jgi:transcriptional regulator with XRE-family HTH domain
VTGTPPVRRRLIGAALRRNRDSNGYPLDTAARVLECDRSKISRIETGQRGIRVKELRELMAEYNVPDGERDALLSIAQTQRGWWQSYADVLPEEARDYIMMESIASEVLIYEPQRIPDLLQTAEYATATATATAGPAHLDQEGRERLVEVLLTRQEAVLRERSVRLEVVIGEAALHQAIGGRDVMRAQLRRLAARAGASVRHPGVSIQVMPLAGGAQPGAASGPLAIPRFDKAPSLGVVYLATLSGGVCLDDAEEVSRYASAFNQLRAAARTPAASASLLRDLARA